MGIYLVAPPLQVWLARCTERELRFYLTLWAVTLLVPYLRLLDERFASLVRYDGGCLYYMFGYLGYALLGYYLRRYVNIARVTWRHAAAFLAVALLPWALYMVRSIPHDVIQDRLSLNAAMLAACYFLALKRLRLSLRWKALCYDFASHSFGIYLVHILVMRYLLWRIVAPMRLHYALQIPLVVILTALLSYLAVRLISKLPGSKYIVGL